MNERLVLKLELYTRAGRPLSGTRRADFVGAVVFDWFGPWPFKREKWPALTRRYMLIPQEREVTQRKVKAPCAAGF